MKNIVLLGGGGHAKSCVDVLSCSKEYKIIGVLDSRRNAPVESMGIKRLGSDNDLHLFTDELDSALICVGQIKDPSPRVRLYNWARALGLKLATVRSPFAHCSSFASLGDGTIVMHNALINANAQIGSNCIINSLALVEHDCIIGSHCHISTGVRMNGGVTVGDRTFIGSGAIIRESVNISEGSIIPAGAVIMSDV